MRKIIPILIIILFSVIAYANTFSNDFVWDDKRFIEDNIGIRSLDNVPGFFTETTDGLYRPLRTTLYTVTYSIWQDNPFGYHVNSLLWHSLISVLVFLIVNLLTTHRFIPLLSALIFAVHPVHTERVTNMTGGFDLLGIFLMLLAFYLYILFTKYKKKSYVVASGTAFVLALFSSEEALVLPLLLLLYEVVFNGLKLNLKDRKKYVFVASFAGVAVAFYVFRVAVIGLGARSAEYVTGSLLTTIPTMLKVALYYLYLVFIPYPLTLYREIETASVFNPVVIFSLLLFLTIAAVTIKYYRKNKLLAFAVGWFFITLLPFSNILPLQALMADRYLYLPSMAASIALAFFIFKIKRKQISLAVATIIMVIFLLLTVDRNMDWTDNVTLWETTAKSSQDSVVYSNLGFAYEQRNRFIDAEQALDKAIAIDPTNEKAHYNLGILYMKQEKYFPAADSFLLAVEHHPSYTLAYDSLGLTYYYAYLETPDAKLLQLAQASFEQAIEVEPFYYKAYTDLGIVKAQVGAFPSALALFEYSLVLNPWNAEAYYNLGIVYEFLEDEPQAGSNFRQASALQPENSLYQTKALQYE